MSCLEVGNPRFLQIESQAQILSEKFPIDLIDATTLLSAIYTFQTGLEGKKIVAYPMSDEQQIRLFVTSNKIFLCTKTLGKGTHSQTSEVLVLATIRHTVDSEQFSPTKPNIKALKIAKNPHVKFSPVKEFMCQHGVATHNNVAKTIETFHAANTNIALCKCYSGTFSEVNFEDISNPVLFGVKVLLGSSKALAIFHLNGLIHRDVKGSNLLFDENWEGILNDFDLIQKVKGQAHKTFGTPYYLDPRMFGDVGNQRKQWGRQDEQGDIYALGITIYRDFLLRLLEWKASKIQDLNLTAPLEQLKIKLNVEHPKLTDEQLETKAQQYNDNLIWVRSNSNDEEIYSVLPSIEDTNNVFTMILDRSDLRFNAKEISVLKGLVDLSCKLRQQQLSLRPSLQEIKIYLKECLAILEDTTSENISSSSSSFLIRHDLYDSTQVLDLTSTQSVPTTSVKTQELFET